MPDRKKGKQIDFIVNTGDPSAASNSANKKRVRSVAALKSWPERRRKLFEQLESSGNGRGAFLVDEPAAKRKASTVARDAREAAVAPHGAGPAPLSPPLERNAMLGPGNVAAPQAEIPYRSPSPIMLSHYAMTKAPATFGTVAQVHAARPDSQCACLGCRYERELPDNERNTIQQQPVVAPSGKKRTADGVEKVAHFLGDSALITPPLSPITPSQGRADPFNCYPVQYQPWFDHVLHYMMTVYAPRGWPALKITKDQGARWERYMTQAALSEPALFYVRLLFGSGDMIRLGTLRNEVQFWLRSQAIKAINTALTDSKRACSDALILAIGRIALHEHMYGDKYASSHVHRPAQKRMIDMRGGLNAMQIPALVKRLMRWSDRIMAVGSGTERMLEDDVQNPNFTLKQSVGAIEVWAPHEGPAVRSKIKIADLMNNENEESRK